MTTTGTHIVIRSLPERSYPVVVARSLTPGWVAGVEPFSRCRGVVILCTDGGLPLELRRRLVFEFESAFRGRLFTLNLSTGEPLKGFEQVKGLVQTFHEAGVRRDGMIIAAGGGSLGDTVGFAAAVWHRGVPWAVVPTTLLSQVDSAVGGKVGVNLDGTKNLLGVYHQPSAVICDVSYLGSLSERDYRSGLGEVVKYGLGMDRYVWDFLVARVEEVLRADPEVLLRLVRRCVSLKAQYVAFDQRDTGMRRYLNLGHTFGHAFEAAATGLSHGDAVALGLLAATRLSIALGFAGEELDRQLQELLQWLSLPTTISHCPKERVMAVMKSDKKHGYQVQTFVVPTQIGEARLVNDPPFEMVNDVIETLL